MHRTLNNDTQIPALGLGTYKLHDEQAVHAALEIGYRHIDTAEYYRNETMIGRVLAEHGIARDEVFITSKVWNNHHGYEPARQAARDTLERLQTDYIDLYLIHWPGDGSKRLDTWRALEEMADTGEAKAIGVSNFSPQQIEDILEGGGIVPAVNQIELHPWNYQQQKPTLDFCHAHEIMIEAYTPLNKGRRFDNGTLQAIARVHDAHPAQVLIAWGLQHGFVTIPKASSREHLRTNFQAASLALSEEEMDALDTL